MKMELLPCPFCGGEALPTVEDRPSQMATIDDALKGE